MTLDQLPFLSWLRLGLGLLLFLGPGYLCLVISPFSRELDRTFSLLVSFGLSVSVWATLLSVTNLLEISIPYMLTFFLFMMCWIIGIWINKSWQCGSTISSKRIDFLWRVLLWSLMLAAFIFSLWTIRNEVAGSGSDSYHHTFFTQMIMDQERLPENYGPSTPIITFTYHFGFHAMTAFLGWFSGIPARLLVLAVGKILVILCAVAVALAAEKMTGSKMAGVTSAILTSIVCVFPSYMLLWGRYTQLTGLTLMGIFLALIWVWVQQKFPMPHVPLLALLATGIGLTHYRVIAMAAVAVITIAITNGLNRLNLREWKNLIVRGFLLFSSSLIGLLPWFIHLWLVSQIGFGITTAPATNSYYSIQRLGSEALAYPTNISVLLICAISIVVGWIVRERIVIALTLWAAIMLFPSRQILLMDTVSVLISMFIPISIVIGWGVSSLEKLIQKQSAPRVIRFGLVPFFLLCLLFGGIRGLLFYPLTIDSYLKQSDLKAMEYIKKEIPQDAYFMINMYRFPFSDTLMVGSDAGYWLPLLAGCRTVVPPMTFTAERVSDPSFAENLRKIEALSGQITSSEGLNMLKGQGITHIYIGERGGSISPEFLLNSNSFHLLYHENRVYIFEIVY